MAARFAEPATPESIWADLTSEIESDSVSRFTRRINEINTDFASRGLRSSSMWAVTQSDAANAELESVARDISTSMHLLVNRLQQHGDSVTVAWLETKANDALRVCADRLAPSADGERFASQIGLLGGGMLRHLQPAFERAVDKQRNALSVIAESLVVGANSSRAATASRPLESTWGILAAIVGALSLIATIFGLWQQSE